ncbi:uncharacterized protein Z520_08281 [Fonsecaea multimorphosa CBS 102226]|uniref:DNA-directed RNA polymerase RBP11-like dimerisation domain-containing protein n=1 Tax=Fonsecaea multimorphosa CBS 102226 TaxID=1442371 RepID=A0A0D2IG41_9EURO|nr:uncharacterized protein Z520_08281 [Fonsecaea multimorphosa CBS 102226]KIX96026.1 hypothetical protein Z520_08281 [Fonsecaea multimorphosa CBS 102226]OAL21795.1 hypothetical protein AYO22_07737 [Fonsecaea multimorphosa]
MSDTSPNQAAATGDKTPPRDALSPRRIAAGQLIPVEGQLWPDHPKNKRMGRVNAGVDTNSVNIPDDDGLTDTKTATKDIVEMTDTEDPGPPSVPVPASRPSPTKARPNHTTYPGAGPGGLPIDGLAWRNHPANRPYQFFSVEQTHHEEINRHECTEAFLLGDDEKKIEEKIDTRTPNTTIFTFNKEDHTLANLLRDKLLKNSHVTFAAYRIPHPLFAKFELRVQTDGEITPKEAVLASSRDLVNDLNVLKTNFTREYELRKMVGGAQNGQ